MKKSTTLRTKVMSILLILVLLFSMMPTQVFAMLGAVTFPERLEVTYRYSKRTKSADILNETSSPNGTYHMLFNDYITFILRPNGMSSTVPTRTIDTHFKDLMKYSTGWADYADKVPVTEQPKFYADTGLSINLKNKASGNPTISLVGTNKLQAVYKITSTDKPVTFKLTYELVRVDVGKTDGEYGGGLIAPDPNDTGRAWAVKVSGTVEYAGTKLYNTNQSSGGDDYGMASFTMVTEHIDFAKNRKSGDQGAIQLSKYSYNYDDNKTVQTSSFWNSGVDMPKMSTSTVDGEITEFFTSSFGTDNQFVATSNYGGGWYGETQISGALGHTSSYGVGGNYGDHVSYMPVQPYTQLNGGLLSFRKTLKVYSTAVMWKEDDTDGKSDFTVDALWGYRDLYTDNDNDTPSDRTYYTQVKNGGHLGIVKESDGTVKAIEGASINALKAAYGDKLLAVYRGDWEREGTDYNFKGNVALSPSVTATARSSYSSFKVSEDGKVTMSLIGLSCPSFQFFTGDESGITFDYANSSAGTLNLKIDPSKNDSVLHLDIPGATSKMEGAKIGIDGSLVFSGTMGISTPILDIIDLQLDRVGMGYDKKGNYKVNGIEASGSVGMPDVIGFPIPSNSATAEINTFNGEERYHFEVEIEIPNLFESEASLTLTRLKNGALVPDDLDLMIGAGVGVPLVPPVVVAEINGIGGGFSDLAKSVNGDFFAVPPAKLSLSARAEVLQMLSGKATMTVGLGYYEKKLSDPEFFDLFGLDAEYKESTYFTVDERTGKNSMTFTGIAVGGSKSLEVHLPNEDVDIISIDSGLSIDVFAGVATEGKKSYVMLDLNGDGKIDGSLKFPKKIGKLKMPSKIAGKTIASTKLELALGLNTVFNLNKDVVDIVWSGVKNASVNATVSYSKKIFGCKLYVTAIFAKKNIKIGVDTWLGDIDTSFSWGKAKNARLMSYGETEDMYYAMYLSSDIQSLGSTNDIQLMSINMEDELVNQLAAAGITLTQNGDGENNYTITVSDSAKTDQLLFSITPKAEATDEQLESMFTVKKDGAEYQLVFDKGEATDSLDDTEDAIASSANAYVSAGGYDEASGEEVSGGVVLKFDSAGEYTISAADAFDIEVLGFELAEYIDTDGTVKELKTHKDYVIRTYLMDSEGEYHMIGEETTADNTTDVSDITISNTQDSVPSGTYTKVYRLLEKISSGENESGEEEFYYVTLDTYEGAEIEVTNPSEIPAPTNVTAQAIGSEILRASWTAPSNMPAGKTIDGYMVTIYEKSGDEWITTGTGYEVRADESGNIPTAVNMALTLGGSGDLDGDGVADDENATLEANKYYRISVATLSDTTADLDGDGVEETASRRSGEAYSDNAGVFIKEATPPTLTYFPTPEVLEGANIKTLYVMPGDEIEIISSERTAISAIRMDDGSELASASGATELTVTVPEFEGNLIIQIDAMDAEGDRTRDYISLKRDTVAPIITFDAESFTADDNGNFTITGVTEAGAEIIVNNDYGHIKTTELDEEPWEQAHYTISQNDDGSFTITGELSDITRGDSLNVGGALIYMQTKDKAGNISDYVYANVVYEDKTATVFFVSDDDTGTMDSVTVNAGDTYTLPENGFTAPDGKQFKAWSVGGAEKAVGDRITVTADTIVTAVWEDIPALTYTVSFAANGGTGTMADVNVVPGEYTLPENGFTAPDGKRFKAWSVGGAEKAVGDKITVTANTTVTAVWENIPAAHTCDIKPVAKVEPTCTEVGKEAYYKCEGCGRFFEDALGAFEITDLAVWGNIGKLGHDFADATCTEKAKCVICAEEYGELAAHTYGTEWKSDGTNHWHECSCGAKADEAVHNGGTASCTVKAACSACSVTYGELAAHTYGTEWKSDGTNHWHECSCGAKADEAAHSGGTATCTVKAACSACGVTYGELAAHTYKDGKCTVCEAVDPDYVPESSSPQTGDNSNMALWIALLFISGGAVITLTVYDRKRRTANR